MAGRAACSPTTCSTGSATACFRRPFSKRPAVSAARSSTDTFEKGNTLFERGVAEYYDYSHFGPDPLKRIITEVMELDVVPMDGKGVIIGDAILNTKRDIKKHFGEATVKAIDAFHAKCHELCSPDEYYEGLFGRRQQAPLGWKVLPARCWTRSPTRLPANISRWPRAPMSRPNPS